ncbi:MAG TPA: hypothetical protein VK020_06635 [Microlunatus sp.]|nr:hypothetical protein [Microlunatus sp.]
MERALADPELGGHTALHPVRFAAGSAQRPDGGRPLTWTPLVAYSARRSGR